MKTDPAAVRAMFHEIEAHGPEAVPNMVRLTTVRREHWPRLLPMLFDCRPPVEGWHFVLLKFWREGSSGVVEAARGNRDTLAEWFGYADFRNCRAPILRAYVATDYKPRELMFRGGQGTADALAQGFSWTSNKAEAVHYAYGRTARPGPPIIIARHVEADEIALQMNTVSRESVVLTPGHESVLKISHTERNALLKTVKRWLAKEAKRAPLQLTDAEARLLMADA